MHFGLAALAAMVIAALVLSPVALGNEEETAPEPTNLRTVHTAHYTIHTDIDPALVADLAKRMDIMYALYAGMMHDFSPPRNAPPLPVYLFNRHKEYMEFTMFQAPNTGGIFMVGPRTCLASFLEGQGRDDLRRTLQHEAFHQFAYFTISKHLPIWLNEGLAQLFEEGIWTGQNFELGQVPPRRVRQLDDDLKRHTLVPLHDFFAVTPQEWINNLTRDADRGATYYNQAWALVHFLTEGNVWPSYQGRLLEFIKLLHQGDDATAAFRQSFPMGVDRLQQDFQLWARHLQPTPQATLLEQQDTLGDFLIALTEKKMHFSTMLAFRNAIMGHGYQLQYTRGHITWTTGDNPLVYFSDYNHRLMSPQELYFQPDPDAPLPDIVCLALPNLMIRTHFYHGESKLEHEELISPAMR